MKWALITAAFALAALLLPTRDVVLFNHSPSIATGFYLRTEAPLRVGAHATIAAHTAAPDYAAQRHFNDANDRFIKRIAAMEGAIVCASGRRIQIGHRWINRQTHDASGRLLPFWRGCRRLRAGELILLGESADSFDGRYWGPSLASDIEGVWRPLRLGPAPGQE